MDSRDIKEPVPQITDGKYLEKIYDLQKELVDHYVGIEGLPPYPIDVNVKKNQLLIKDFIGRVIEELAEGYESMLLVQDLTEKNKLWFGDYNDHDYEQCLNHLQNVSEEMADAMHFMVELLIYVNIQPSDILSYVTRLFGHKWKNLRGNKDDILYVTMLYGAARHYEKDNVTEQINLTRILDLSQDTELESPLYTAASFYSEERYLEFKKCLWDITYHLNIARNFLKNKPWKQSQMMTDEINFQREIVEAFIDLLGAYAIINLDSESLFYIYFKKNQVNSFRIRSNY